MRRTWRSVAGVVLVASVALAACGGDDGGSASESASSGASAKAEGGDRAAQAAVDASAPVADRDITYTADLVVRVADAERASERGTALAEAADGYLAGQQADLQGQRQSTLTIRVPAPAFRQVLAQLAKLGVVQDKSIDSTDVTAEVVDLSGRLESQRASAARLRTLLGAAGTAGDLVTIEQELSKRESEIESLEGKLRVLDDQVTLATITVRFTEKAEPKQDHDGSPGFVDALKAGGGTLLAIGRGLVVVLGFVLPFLPLVALGWLGYRTWRRRHPRAVPPPFAPTPMAPFPSRPPPAAARPVAGAPVRPAPPAGPAPDPPDPPATPPEPPAPG